jgi:hypothetical protein
MRILSIDIGTKNCAFYIEEFNDKDFTELKNMKSDDARERLYKIGARVYWKVVNFEKDLKEGIELFVPMIKFLDDNRGVWDTCNGVILEKQMSMNYNAQVVQHFIFSYFKDLYGTFKYISDISATRKTQVLNAPKKMTKLERKKWAVVEAKKVMTLRKDEQGLKILSTTKADDLADCLLQLKAFQKLVFVDGMLP